MTLSRRERLLLGGGFCSVVALVLARALPPALQWRAQQIASGKLVLARYELAAALLRNERSIRDSLATRRSQLIGYDSAYVSSPSAAIAEATLAGVLLDIASATEVKLDAVQFRLGNKLSMERAPMEARLTASGDLQGLAMFLSTVEIGPPLLAVRELSITQSEPAIAHNKVETLRAELLVEAIVHIDSTHATVNSRSQ